MMIVHFIYHNQPAKPINKYFIYWQDLSWLDMWHTMPRETCHHNKVGSKKNLFPTLKPSLRFILSTKRQTFSINLEVFITGDWEDYAEQERSGRFPMRTRPGTNNNNILGQTGITVICPQWRPSMSQSGRTFLHTLVTVSLSYKH